jgi:hypothetical protein
MTLRDSHRRLLMSYRGKAAENLWHTLPKDGYIQDHLVRHLEEAEWEDELGTLLWEESTDGQCGWYQARERLGQTIGFLADVRCTWNHADRMVSTATSGELRGQAIGLQFEEVEVLSVRGQSVGRRADTNATPSLSSRGRLALPGKR